MAVPNVPSCSEEEGNTITSSPKKINPAIRWCFTFNNYSEAEFCSVCSTIQATCRLGIVGKEVGESGTPHLQGYIELKKKSRPLSVFTFTNKISWRKCKGTKEENITYCSKDDKNPFLHNCKIRQPLKLISPDMFYDWQKEIIEIIKKEPDNRKIYWYWSNEGGVGKTQFCKYLSATYGAMCLHGKGSDVRNGIVTMAGPQGLNTPELVLYPIPRSHNSDYISYESLENIKDMYFYSGKYEGGMINGNPPHLFVFANEPPNEFKMSNDRWVIKCIDAN